MKNKIIALALIAATVSPAEARHPFRRFTKAVLTFPVYTCAGLALGIVAGAGVSCLGPVVWYSEVKADAALDKAADARKAAKK